MIFNFFTLIFQLITILRTKYLMIKPLPEEKQQSIKALLAKQTPYKDIQSQFPDISKNTLSRYKKRFFPNQLANRAGRPAKLGYSEIKFTGRKLRTGDYDSIREAQGSLKERNVELTTSGLKKALKRHSFKSKVKRKTNFVSKANQKNVWHGPNVIEHSE